MNRINILDDGYYEVDKDFAKKISRILVRIQNLPVSDGQLAFTTLIGRIQQKGKKLDKNCYFADLILPKPESFAFEKTKILLPSFEFNMENLAFYEELAKDYNDLMSIAFCQNHNRETIANKISMDLSLSNTSRILEVACGTGIRSTFPLMETLSGGFIVGFDFSKNMIKACRRTAKQQNYENVHVMRGQASCIPFHNNSFDLVFLSHTFYSLSHHGKIFSEMKRVAKPGRWVALVDRCDDDLCDLATIIYTIAEEYKAGQQREYIFKYDDYVKFFNFFFHNIKAFLVRYNVVFQRIDDMIKWTQLLGYGSDVLRKMTENQKRSFWRKFRKIILSSDLYSNGKIILKRAEIYVYGKKL